MSQPHPCENLSSAVQGQVFLLLLGDAPPRSAARTLTLWTLSNEPGLLRRLQRRDAVSPPACGLLTSSGKSSVSRGGEGRSPAGLSSGKSPTRRRKKGTANADTASFTLPRVIPFSISPRW